MRKFFKKGEVVNDILTVEAVNEKINPGEWVVSNSYTFDKSEIAGMGMAVGDIKSNMSRVTN